MMLDGIKNLYVLYGRLCGGMHLTHMLKMCPIFRAHPHQDNYIKKIIFLYEKNIISSTTHLVAAHVQPHRHIGDIYDIKSKDSLLNAKHINLLQGHIPCFYKALNKNIIQDLGPYAGILINLPSNKNSIAFKRIKKFKDNLPAPNDYHLPFSITSESNVFKLDYHNAIAISSDELFTPHGSSYIRDVVKEKFNLVLPNEADVIHNIWFNLIKDNV